MTLPVRPAGAVSQGASDPALDPSTGGLEVTIVGGAAGLAAGAATSANQTSQLAQETTTATETTAIAGQLPASLGAHTPATSLGVTGSLATATPSELADTTATGSAVALGSLVAGPSGVRVQNTSASGQPNIRVGSGSISTTRGVQLAPGVWEIFPVTNASALYVIAESGSPTVGVSQA